MTMEAKESPTYNGAMRAVSALLQTARNLSVSVANDLETIDGLLAAGVSEVDDLKARILAGIDEKVRIIREYRDFKEGA
jgi:hypothetical protein